MQGACISSQVQKKILQEGSLVDPGSSSGKLTRGKRRQAAADLEEPLSSEDLGTGPSFPEKKCRSQDSIQKLPGISWR